MEITHKSYKLRIFPNIKQQILLNKHFGCNRFIFNHYLVKEKENHKLHKKYIKYIDNAKDLTNLKKQEEYKWLNEVSCQSLQASLKNLDIAYKLFFKKQSSFPKFKTKNNNIQSFLANKDILLKNNKLYFTLFREGIPISLKNRKINNDEICYVTMSKTPTNKYYTSITVRTKHESSKKTGSFVGIDTGIKTLAVLSDGTEYENIRTLKTNLKKIQFNQKQLSKKKKGSNSRKQQKLKLARVHEKLKNIRKDHLQKITTNIIKNHDIICIESLKIKNMMQNHKLAQAFSDVALGSFYEMLIYKAKWNNKQIIKINQWFPSSKTCNFCKHIKENLTLNDREWVCERCNTKHDRDLNASKNILEEGLRIYNLNCGSGIESQNKQKEEEAFTLVKSTNLHVHHLIQQNKIKNNSSKPSQVFGASRKR